MLKFCFKIEMDTNNLINTFDFIHFNHNLSDACKLSIYIISKKNNFVYLMIKESLIAIYQNLLYFQFYLIGKSKKFSC